MRKNISPDVVNNVAFLVGDIDTIAQIMDIPAREPFHIAVIDFLNDLSKRIMGNRAAKTFSDLVTYAFWIRRANVMKLKERFEWKDNNIYLGRGVAFHVAPSNVPINFAYSLAAGLLCGNANIVRIPSKDFEQVRIIAEMINDTLENHEEMRAYICLLRYSHEKIVNDLFSSMADVRVVWGGDRTIDELRKSPLQPRCMEICFADRYSMAVINSDAYMMAADKKRIAEDFYNDTYFTDQNACTSPRLIVWMGNDIERAKDIFWEEEQKIVDKRYRFQSIQGINKLTKSCLLAIARPDCKVEENINNMIVRMKVQEITDQLIDYSENSGFFLEYDCQDIKELDVLCRDKRCQTIAYVGDIEGILPLLRTGIKGIDRIVPVGKTMDFDLIWDGYELPFLLTRTISLVE